MKIGNVLHVGVSVYSMEESLAWYEKNLDFKLYKDDGFVPPLGARICFIEKDGFSIELFEYEAPKPLPEDRLEPNSDLKTVGTKHMAFAVDDMDGLKQKFAENGVDIAMEGNMEGNKIMFIRDCNGVLIELIENRN